MINDENIVLILMCKGVYPASYYIFRKLLEMN